MTRRRKQQLHHTPAAAARQREASAAALVGEAADEAERTGDLSRLRKVAAVRGLATNALRARLWPLLAGVPSPSSSVAAARRAAAAPPLADATGADADDNNNGSRSSSGRPSPCSSPLFASASDTDSPELRAYLLAAASPRATGHRDAPVVACDVERSLWRLCGDGERPARRAALARVLGALLATEGGEEAVVEGVAAEQRQQQEEAGRGEGGAPRSAAAGSSASAHKDASSGRPSSSSPLLPPNEDNPNNSAPENDGPVRYYQGLHDVASVLLVVLSGDELASFQILRRLSRCHLRDATRPSLEAVVELLSLALPQIVRAADPELADALDRAGLPPFYALSWAITWFSHDVRDATEAARLFDLFLSAHPLMPLYVGAAAMRARRASLLRVAREGEAEGEAMPRLHTALVNMDALGVPGGADRLACEALELFSRLPPEGALAAAARAAAAAAAAADSAAAGRLKGKKGVASARAPPRAGRLRLAVTPRAYLSAPGGEWRVPRQDGAGGGAGGGGSGGGAALLGAWTARQIEAFLDAVARLASPASQPHQQTKQQQQQLALRRRPGAPASAADGRAFAPPLLPVLLQPLPAALRPVAAYAVSGFVLVAAVLAALVGRGPGLALGGMRF